jgi:putative acetyltransferase
MVIFREIEEKDNKIIAEVIRRIFREFKIDRPGTVYTDPTTDDLFTLFKTPSSRYWICEEDGVILGGCGIFPTQGLPEGCAELVKFYLSKESRGRGIGKTLILKSIETARELGFSQLYLESFPELEAAVHLYKKIGFKMLDKPMGNSGHFACNIWALMVL